MLTAGSNITIRGRTNPSEDSEMHIYLLHGWASDDDISENETLLILFLLIIKWASVFYTWKCATNIWMCTPTMWLWISNKINFIQAYRNDGIDNNGEFENSSEIEHLELGEKFVLNITVESGGFRIFLNCKEYIFQPKTNLLPHTSIDHIFVRKNIC